MVGMPISKRKDDRCSMAKCKWKGRGIYEAPRVVHGKATEAYIDIPHDRQSFEGEDEGNEFLNWLNKEAIPAVLKWANMNSVQGSSAAMYELHEGNRHMKATPNASFGYMYLEACQD